MIQNAVKPNNAGHAGHAIERPADAGRPREGFVLIFVLVVIVLLSMSALTFAELMVREREAVELVGQQHQAMLLAESGAESARLFLLNTEAARNDAGGIYNNPGIFQAQTVLPDEDPRFEGRFAIVAPALDPEGRFGGVRFGLEDESARLNVNLLLVADAQQENGGRDLLMTLPGMTEEIADAILDWIDEDEDPRTFGAEADYYLSLPQPYKPRNGPLATVEELLLVKGVTPELFFGLDQNRNGQVDPHEAGRALDAEADNSDGSLNRGWAAYLTVHGAERNVNAEGTPRIYVNQEDLGQLYRELVPAVGKPWADFIVAYRQFGPAPVEGGKAVPILSRPLDFKKKAAAPITTVLDLVGAHVRVTHSGGGSDSNSKSELLHSPLPIPELVTAEALEPIVDKITVNPNPIIPGRLNINQAPRELLLGLPGITEEKVNRILSLRGAGSDQEGEANAGRQHETWLFTVKPPVVETLEEMKTLMPLVTGGGDVYRAQVIGYFRGGGPSARIELLLDATTPEPRVILWRDISTLGRGYRLDQLDGGVAE